MKFCFFFVLPSKLFILLSIYITKVYLPRKVYFFFSNGRHSCFFFFVLTKILTEKEHVDLDTQDNYVHVQRNDTQENL